MYLIFAQFIYAYLQINFIHKVIFISRYGGCALQN